MLLYVWHYFLFFSSFVYDLIVYFSAQEPILFLTSITDSFSLLLLRLAEYDSGRQSYKYLHVLLSSRWACDLNYFLAAVSGYYLYFLLLMSSMI